MGNLCGKTSRSESDTHPFAHPGQTLSSPPPANPRASIPKTTSSGGKSEGRTLGAAVPAQRRGGEGPAEDARTAAARAAEERAAKATQAAQKGKLGRNLAKEKALGVNGQLEEASRQQRAHRDTDDATRTRNYN